MRNLSYNNQGSAVPILLFVITIFSCGALYTFFFIEFAFPQFSGWIPASDGKTFIMMCIYAIPLIVLVVGSISLLQAGLKRGAYY